MKKTDGFTLIELVIAIGLSAIFIPAIIFVYSFSLGSASEGEKYSEAYSLAQDVMEKVYYLKENDAGWDWTNGPYTDEPGEYFELANESGEWKLKNSATPYLSGEYEVALRVIPVKRNGDEVSESSWSDSNDLTTRKVVVTVSWQEKGMPADIDLVSYVSKH